MSIAWMVKKIVRRLTAEDKAAAKKLRDIWDLKASHLGLDQNKMAEALGNRTQGLVSQYLNGKIALGIAVTLIFARKLGVHATEIRADLAGRIGELDPESYMVGFRYMKLGPAERRKFEAALVIAGVSEPRLITQSGKTAKPVKKETAEQEGALS